MKVTIRVLAFLAVAVLSLPLAAADNGFYIGGAVGQSLVNIDEIGDIEIDDEATAWKAFAGGRFITFIGVEAAYRDLGSVSAESTNFGLEADITGFDLQGVFYVPIVIADIFLKAGVMEWETELTETVGGDIETISNDGNDPIYGAGVQFRFSSFCIRGEVEYFDIESTDELFMYSIGASYTF